MLAAIGEPPEGQKRTEIEDLIHSPTIFLWRIDGHAGRNEETNESG